MALFSRKDLVQKFSEGGIVKGFSDYQILLEAQDRSKHYDIFLSHSYLNASEISILKEQIEEFGFSVYVDWIEDKQLSRNNVTKKTAKVLQERMKNCNCLIYAHTTQSVTSKWMPWELGFFDGYKGKVAILPVTDERSYSDTFEGQEYLGIYPYIVRAGTSIDSSDERLWVCESDNIYVLFNNWLLQNEQPYKRTK